MLRSKISVVILNWNGREFLEKCIPSILEAKKIYNHDCQVLVVDNASTDGSVAYMKSEFPYIKVSVMKDNLGFAKAMNVAIKEAGTDIVIGLNNDVIVDKNFIYPLVKHFEKSTDIFSVAAKMLLWDKKTLNFGRAIGNFRFGIFRRIFEDPKSHCNALYSCGGAFAVDRKKFLALAGFDEEINAFWEDMDLCYRAWKQGYRTIYEPESLIFHKMHGSFNKIYRRQDIQRISAESYFTFAIKNFHDKGIILSQIISLPILLLAALVFGKAHFALGVLKSIRKWPLFINKRKAEKSKSLISDRQVLAMVSQ